MNLDLNAKNQEINTCKSEHTQRMNDALAKFDQWKTATDKKHSDAVKSLEAQLAELRK